MGFQQWLLLLLGALAVVLLVIFVLPWLQGETPAPEPPVELPLELGYPRSYRVEATGTLRWDDVTVPGVLRARYAISPDGDLEISHLTVWAEDVDLVVEFLWWEVKRERLRCTRLSSMRPIQGTVEGDELVIAPGAMFSARTHDARDASGDCAGKVRTLEFETDEELRATHQPEANYFALDGSFTSETSTGDPATITIEMEGSYINRPPTAVITTAPPLDDPPAFVEGCPDTGKGEPPMVLANTPDGLSWTLRSESYDDDGSTAEPGKKSRADISFEKWLYWGAGEFRYLGNGRQKGPVLFATGSEHKLLLVAVDRSGAQGRAICHFQVVEPN